MNPLAEALNQIVAQCNPNILDMLSGIGKQLYFPKGILSQCHHRHRQRVGAHHVL
jgi:hypothetical protein